MKYNDDQTLVASPDFEQSILTNPDLTISDITNCNFILIIGIYLKIKF